MSRGKIEYENLRKVNEPFFTDYQTYFEQFLQSGWYILGNSVKKFEQAFADYTKTQHCVGVASGLDALILAIDALDLPKGSEIIVPSNTYIATILAILRNDCVPVLVEPNIATYNIDETKIAEKITSKTKAILVVHLYGKICQMDAIMAIAATYELAVIEDVAQAHGAMLNHQQAGSFGIGCFSFYPTKNLGALGDAGAITCQSDKLAERIMALRNYGSKVKYHNDYVGYNSRLDEVQAGFLSIKLQHLDEINQHKRKLAKLYLEHLDEGFIKPVVKEGFFDVYHIFNVRHAQRDRLKDYLLENSIMTEIHYPIAPHQQQCMQGILAGTYPISEEIHATTLSLPISYFHTVEDILQVCAVMNQWIAQFK